jgi:hypothetical protein
MGGATGPGFPEGEDDDEEDDDDNGDGFEDEHPKASKKAGRVSGGDKRKGQRGKKKGGSGGGGGGGDAGGGGGGGGADGGEKYEKLPAKVRYMLRFQEALAKLPEQVVRYEWDGTPLWPVPPATVAAARGGAAGRHGHPVRPPRCRCGSERRFEMQLTPSLLLGLRPEDHTTAVVEGAAGGGGLGAGAGAASDAGGPPQLPGGMDFLTVLVYSCEASCEGPGGGAASVVEEWALVVPAED